MANNEKIETEVDNTEKWEMPDRKDEPRNACNFCERISSFYLEQQFSDITININGQKTYAHKVILAARSKYFESIFVEDSQQSEIVISDASIEAFQEVLKFIYTGSTTLSSTETELNFEILGLACKYSLTKLGKSASEQIASMVSMDNVFNILNKANEHEMGELRDVCHKFVDNHCVEILKNEKLNSLTQKSMMNLLERNSLGMPEIEIFKSVARWCEHNTDVDNLVVNCVRLDLLTNADILMTVYPTKLIEDHKLLAVVAANTVNEKSRAVNENLVNEAVSEKSKADSGVEDSISPTLTKDINLATPEQAEVISGMNTSYLLHKNQRELNKFAFHVIGDDNGITIKLKNPQYVNHIHMKFWHNTDKLNSHYYQHYDISLSVDNRNWKKVIDYRHCCSYQNLYFEQILAQYIKIHGTFSLVSGIYFTSFTPTLTNGIVHPVENVATSQKGAIVIHGKDLLNLVKKSSNNFITSSSLGSSSAIIIQLAQPYIIGSMKFLLRDKISYSVETSTNNFDWKFVGHYTNESSWQNLHFEEGPVVYIKITSRDYDSGGKPIPIGCACFECPSSEQQ